VKAGEFRRLALALPGAVEGAHMGHADFRTGGRIFASLGPAEDWAMVKLPADEQAALIDSDPDVYSAFAGAWGRFGATRIELEAARRPVVGKALEAAFRNVSAPRPRRRKEKPT